jgi:hypothetical protein
MNDQKIYIFGDSYAETRDNKRHQLFEYSWPRKLETAFDVANFAVGGSGPQDVCIDLHNLVSTTDKQTLERSIAIIVLPDISRYNFSFYNKRNHSVFGQLNDNHTIDHFFTQEFLDNYSQDKLEFILNFRKFYLEHSINWAIEEVKYLSYFDNIATCFKQTLVISVNALLSNQTYQNIDIAPIDLESISKHDMIGNAGFGHDNRLNHISLENHNVMLEQLFDWIVNRTPIKNKFITK